MQYEGTLTKMQTEYGDPIQYYLVFEDSFLNMNQQIGKDVEISLKGFQCLNCSKQKKIFRQGFCYDCFYGSASAGDWIMRPELSTAHLGIADRDLDYETKVQVQPHVVYLACSSELKVGVTRKTQVPTRWIDQGAEKAIVLVEVPNRYLAGIAEVALKSHVADKINWRKMLTNAVGTFDLPSERMKLQSLLPREVQEYFLPGKTEVYELKYPVSLYPGSISSHNLDKVQTFSGKLAGIKGQYLIFEDGGVFNVRAFEGYRVTVTV